MVVYADLFICINLIVNYALLGAAGALRHRRLKRGRLLGTAFLGALCALLLFFDFFTGWVLWIARLLLPLTMVRLAYRYTGWREYLCQFFVFFLVNFLFAGTMFALWTLVAPRGMVLHNGIVYFHISPVQLILFTGAAYLAVSLLARLGARKGLEREMYDVTLILGQKQANLTGFWDTGNTMADPYSGCPVAVAQIDSVRSLLPRSLLDLFEAVAFGTGPQTGGAPSDGTPAEPLYSAASRQFKMIPFHTVGRSGVLPAFLPDRIILRQNGREYTVENTYVALTGEALSSGAYDILLNDKMELMETRPAAAR